MERLKHILSSLPGYYILVDANTLEIKEHNIHEPSVYKNFSSYNELILQRTDCEKNKTISIKDILHLQRPQYFQQSLNISNEIKLFRVFTRPIKNEQGELIEIFEYFDEIDELKNAAHKHGEQEKYYKNVLNDLHEGIAIVDEDENIIFCNPYYGKILDLPVEKLEGASLKDIFDPNLFPFLGGSRLFCPLRFIVQPVKEASIWPRLRPRIKKALAEAPL